MTQKKFKILIVEDETPMREALLFKFQKEGFEVIAARDGEEGLSLAEKERPDLILLDIIMPKMDGMTVLQKLRGEDWGKDIPVILLTNLSESEKAIEAMGKGVHDYLVKSDWRLEDVVAKVRERLGIHS